MCFKSGTPIEDDVFMINKFVSAIENRLSHENCIWWKLKYATVNNV